MRKIVLFLMIIFTATFIVACSDSDRSFTIDQVDIHAEIDEQGDIYVSELYRYTFDGEYEGLTRDIKSDADLFKAYLVEVEDAEATISTEGLASLRTEKDDQTYKIYSDSTDETKQILYHYRVKGSVNKYTDVGEVEYAFFDKANKTDLHDLTITIETPSKKLNDDVYYYLREDGEGTLTAEKNSLFYETNLLEAGKESMLHFIFPADELSKMKITKDKEMKDRIIQTEEERQERRDQLADRMDLLKPYMWAFLIGIILIVIIVSIKHPIRYRGKKDLEDLIQLVEDTDPLLMSYLNNFQGISPQSLIAALFSLKKRDIIRLEEVAFEKSDDQTTFKFLWHKEDVSIDLADEYLRKWLFTENDGDNDYFILSSIIDDKKEDEDLREKKAKAFEEGYQKWRELVRDREAYQNLKHPFHGYSIVSILFLVITFGVFTYFMQVEPISSTTQVVLISILGFLGLVYLVFSRNKWVITIYYLYLIITSIIAFTITSTGIWTILSFGLTYIALLSIPATYWKKDLRKLKYAMTQCFHLFNSNDYPIGSDLEKLEERLMYAIILGRGKKYAEQCGKEEFIGNLKIDYPLLNNPVHTSEVFHLTNMGFYSTAALTSSTSTTTSSSTGGGGAGAF